MSPPLFLDAAPADIVDSKEILFEPPLRAIVGSSPDWGWETMAAPTVSWQPALYTLPRQGPSSAYCTLLASL